MARSHHNHENIDIENAVSQTIYFDKQQLFENNTDNHKMSNTPKPTKEQEHENSFRRKLLREYITSRPEDPDLICPYINLDKYLLSQVITNIKTLGKKWKKNLE